MRYALIKNGTVSTVAYCDDESFANTFLANLYDACVSIDDSSPVSPGYAYADSVFTAPLPKTPNYKEANIKFGQSLVDILSADNKARQLNALQRYQQAQALSGVFGLITTGDIITLAAILGSIPVDGTIITSSIISELHDKTTSYLASTGQNAE